MKLLSMGLPISIILAVIVHYRRGYGLQKFGHPPTLSRVIVEFLQGPPSLRKGMTATVQKIGGVLQDERLVSGKGRPWVWEGSR